MLPWLQALRSTILPKGPLGEAIRYALNQWQALNRYLEDGRLAIDNILLERQVRGVAVGRNWHFAGSDEGTGRAAVPYSIVSTCSLQGAEPWAFPSDVLQRPCRRRRPCDVGAAGVEDRTAFRGSGVKRGTPA